VEKEEMVMIDHYFLNNPTLILGTIQDLLIQLFHGPSSPRVRWLYKDYFFPYIVLKNHQQYNSMMTSSLKIK
jgi:hypothetical protein